MPTEPGQANQTARWLALGALFVALFSAVAATRSCAPRAFPALPPASSSVTVVKATPSVLLAVKDLARLESASFHMERVIDLSEKQSRAFGLIETEDALLLVAVADVSGGVDLGKLEERDIVIDAGKKSARITLPRAEIFHTELDNQRTYVHTRRTGVLAARKENLESRARAEAERTLVEAAKEAGILKRSSENAKRVVEGLVRSLGYEQVEVSVRN